MSTLKVNALQNTSGVNLTRVLQVVQHVKTDTVSGTVAAGAITGFDSTFNGTITPSSTSSLIYITGFVNVAVSGQVSNVSIVYRRNSANITSAVNGSGTTTPIGDASGSRKQVAASGNNTDPAGNCFTLSLLDKPQSTSQLTYSLALGHGSGSSRTMYINEVNGDTNSSGLQRAASVMILMEIAP